ncbi:MAG: HD domain-containing protein, partial [Tepidiformaceae bacterium]
MTSAAGFFAALRSNPCLPALRALDEAGELTGVLPELEAGRGFVQPELHYFDVLQHNLAAVGALDLVLSDSEENRELRAALAWVEIETSLGGEIEGMSLLELARLGCLLHDVAKPATATQIEGRLRFPRHGPRGAEMMIERLPLWGLGPEATLFVSRLIRYHLRPRELIINWPPSDRAVRKFVADLDGHVLPLMLVNLCDGMATRGPLYTREHFRRHCNFVNYVVARAWAANEEGEPPLITGDDLIAELGLSGGRLLGAVLTSIRRAQVDGAICNRDQALSLARSVFASLPA